MGNIAMALRKFENQTIINLAPRFKKRLKLETLKLLRFA